MEKKKLEQYMNLKEMIYYLSAKGITKEELLKKFQNIIYESEEQKEICINTILYPDDIAILSQLTNPQGEESISKKLNIPVDIVRAKATEYSKYKVWDLIKNNQLLKYLAYEASSMEASQCDTAIKSYK